MAAGGFSSTQELLQKLRNIETFRIVFDNPSGTYFAGRILTGKVLLNMREPLKMKGVYIHVKGLSHVHIPDKDRLYDPFQSDCNGSKLPTNEIYFDVKKPLSDTETRGTIREGSHAFPFSMDLPAQLPTSFEGQYGYIRYYCVAIISRPWKVNAKCKAAFTVLSRTDLNRIAESEDTITRSASKRLRNILKKTDPITSSLTLNKTAFVPGQKIMINAEIINESTREITNTVVSLMSKVTYRSGGFYRQVTKPVCQTSTGSRVIHPKQCGSWTDVPLKIPPIPPTSMGNCKNICVTYFVQLKVVTAGLVSTDVEVVVPVCIGTVPLRADFSLLTPTSLRPFVFPPSGSKFFSGLPSVHNASAATNYLKQIWEQQRSPSPPPTYEHFVEEYPDMPPPSYEQCVFGKVNIREEEDGEETMGELEFAPHYAIYHQTSEEHTS